MAGLAKGLAKGMEKGRAEGREEVMEKGIKAEILTTARNLKVQERMSVEEIAQITQLSIEEVREA